MGGGLLSNYPHLLQEPCQQDGGGGGGLEMRSSFSMGAVQHACTALCRERVEGNLSWFMGDPCARCLWLSSSPN